MTLRFDDKVVVITGAGHGLGKAHALAFAARGAKVVVNGRNHEAADGVVAEIKSQGGQAAANYDSVENGDKIIDTAIEAFGRVDVLINNAGVLRDVSLNKMTDEDWDLINAVHLRGVYKCTKAAWPHMINNKFGRIINVTSAAGIYGNFGQVNYSTAKSGIIGFTKSCAIEGGKKNVFSNCVAPIAASRMTETIMPPDMLESLKPEAVVALSMYMCHESSECNSEVIECGGGWYAKIRVERSKGAHVKPTDGTWSPEDVKGVWDTVVDFKDADHPTTVQDTIKMCLKKPSSQEGYGSDKPPAATAS